MKVIIYEAASPLRQPERFIAFLVMEGRKPGQSCLSTVHFYGATAEIAENSARAFWKDETEKAAALKERGRLAGLGRRKAVA